MNLTPKQIENYVNKLRIFGPTFNVNEKGVFVCEIREPEEDVKNIVNDLKVCPFVQCVNYFNIFQNKKRQYFIIQGILKEKVNESVEIHDELNPKIWTKENELIPEVRAKILQIVDKFKNQLAVDGVDLKIEDIYLLGSNANFNYNEDSDLDIHIIADESFDCSEEHLNIIYNCYKALFNKKYDINIKGINVELYVENKDKLTNISAGIYSFKDGWIRTPSRYKIPDFDQNAIDQGVKIWEDKYFDITLDPTVKKVDEYLDSIYELRKESIQKDGEFGTGNLVFKEIRRLGYLDDLRELKIELTSQELSLESLEEKYKIKLSDGTFFKSDIGLDNDVEFDTEEEATDFINKNYNREELLKGYEIIKESKEKIAKCEKRGRPLVHSDECRLCDLGDESVLDEHITPIGRASSEINGIDFEKEEVMNGKVKDWMCADQPYEFQLEDIPNDLTWGKLIEAIKKGEMDKVISLDTAPQEHIWQRACELYYLQTGYFADKDFEAMCKNPEKRKWLKLVKFEEDK